MEFTASAPAKASPPKLERNSILLQESAHTLHPLAEEAAMLFANGRESDARALLESAVKLNLGKAAESVWTLLFDIYLLSDQKEAFEALALEYVERFEKSPPSWSPLAAASPTAGPAGPAVVTLTGKLNAGTQAQLEQARRLSAHTTSLRIDLSRVSDADLAGCTLLLGLLHDLARVGKECKFGGAGHLAGLLEVQIDAGRREGRDIWLLLLQLYQQQGQSDPFEDLALQYAITFEESPPSWEEAAPTLSVAAKEEMIPESGYVLHGEITGGGSEALAGLPAYGAAQQEVVIDASALRRMDFVSAGMLLNALSALASKGKTLRLHGLNAPVFNLLNILGIQHLARLERRK